MSAVTGRQELAELRHALRTPLNQILGYADILIEDAEQSGLTAALEQLHRVQSEARQIVGMVQTHLVPDSEHASEEALEALRSAILPAVHRIVREVGALAQQSDETLLGDVLRISTAAVDLVAFAQGEAPVHRAHASTPVPVREAGSTPAHGHLLVVDDNEANRDMLSRQLERFGYRVTAAEDGRDALSLLRRAAFDLVLLDVMMPGLDGIEVLEQMQADSALRSVAVVMVSALDELGGVAHCLEHGADDYIFKPFDPVLLRARVAATLERKRLRDEQQQRTRELERMQRELERSNEDLQRFASLASHDLQAPLRGIITHLQLLERRLGGQLVGEDRSLIDHPIDAARRMVQLLRDLLAFSRVSTEDRQLEPVDLEDVLETVLRDLVSDIEQSSAEVSHDPLPVVVADRVQISRVFQNLLGNALKYRSDAIPRIHVTAQREGREWHFVVADNGIGIADPDLAAIFQMYRRGDTGNDRPGSGLGLAICQRILERMNGRIWAQHRAGGGSEFHFCLPVSNPAEAAANA